MKTCSRCQQEKPLADFYNHSSTADGLRSICKKCHNEGAKKWQQKNPEKRKVITRKWRQENPEKCALYNRKQYHKNPEKRAALTRKWRQENPEKMAALTRKCRQKNPEKIKARVAVKYAVASGNLVKPEACQHCNTPTESRRLHGHHHDYSKPLDVVWLCAKCHGAEHRKYPEIDGGTPCCT